MNWIHQNWFCGRSGHRLAGIWPAISNAMYMCVCMSVCVNCYFLEWSSWRVRAKLAYIHGNWNVCWCGMWGVLYSICYIYSTVKRSIADIYNPRWHIYQGAKCQGKYAAEVINRGYGPTNVLCILYTVVSAQQMNLLPKMLREMTPFLPKKYMGYMRPLRNT